MVALTLDVQIKWLDNLLSHHDLPGCTKARQGVERRISDEGILAIELVRVLNTDLGIPLGRAVTLVRDGLSKESGLAIRMPSGITIVLPHLRIEQRIASGLRDAIEAAPRIARGRPPLRNT
ncbi:MAG TPA: hypothetical protein VFO66_10920 [Gemmatimonadaceae bacterium]|nr:hypothetical protein [Gemmatimonadaceae bacterium]